eukprot:TRINITY_DN5945_c0_g1_i1.p1 TRINITY_DN5945_c0_g1~~TRINITY_DN5945_c0_g1_i1.p1  ORF type:complete len:385 (+),score=63.02 TRINITY_DN5945_c0_g1_i1:188-1342(+)
MGSCRSKEMQRHWHDCTGKCRGDKDTEFAANPVTARHTPTELEQPRTKPDCPDGALTMKSMPNVEPSTLSQGTDGVRPERQREYSRAGDCIVSFNACRSWEGGHSVSSEQLVKDARTGDVILFSNSLNSSTLLISCATMSNWDHVGVVVRFPQPIGVRLLEAVYPRVVLEPLGQVVAAVKSGNMYWRRLKRRDGNECFSTQEEEAIQRKALKLHGTPYNTQFKYFVKSWLCCDHRHEVADPSDAPDAEVEKEISCPEGEEQLFCSQAVAALYLHAGLLDKTLASYNFVPKDFSTDAGAKLHLQVDYELSTERRVLWSRALFEFCACGRSEQEMGPVYIEMDEEELGLTATTVSYTHLRAHETVLDLVCRLLLEKKKTNRLSLYT